MQTLVLDQVHLGVVRLAAASVGAAERLDAASRLTRHRLTRDGGGQSQASPTTTATSRRQAHSRVIIWRLGEALLQVSVAVNFHADVINYLIFLEDLTVVCLGHHSMRFLPLVFLNIITLKY